MSLSDASGTIRAIAGAVVILELFGAILTFRPVRERRIGIGSLFMVGFIGVPAGSLRSPLLVGALIPGTCGLVASVAIFLWARITIHGQYFSYINSNDVPQFVCSKGPYHWVRHPFYASYMLSLLSMTAMFPNPVAVGASLLAVLAFNSAAAFEEKKFKLSPVAAEYARYVRRTGRFLPRFRREAGPESPRADGTRSPG